MVKVGGPRVRAMRAADPMRVATWNLKRGVAPRAKPEALWEWAGSHLRCGVMIAESEEVGIRNFTSTFPGRARSADQDPVAQRRSGGRPVERLETLGEVGRHQRRDDGSPGKQY